MKALVVLALVLLAALAVSCSEDSGVSSPSGNPVPGGGIVSQGQAQESDNLSRAVIDAIKRDATERALVIDVDSIQLEVLENDGQFAKVRAFALIRWNAASAPLEQEATLEARNPVGEGWIVGFLSFWDDTQEQKTAYAEATAEAERLARGEAKRLVTVELIKTQEFYFDRPYIPVIIHNGHRENHTVQVRATFLFPDGELWHTESSDRSIPANSTLEDTLGMRSAVPGEWEALLPKYGTGFDVFTDEPYEPVDQASIIEWQLVIDGKEGEIHQIGG